MAEFTLLEDQKLIQETMRSFAQEEMRKIARECDESCTLPDEILEKVWGLGICPTSIPEPYGGYGFDRSTLTGLIMAEEIAYGDLSLAMAALTPMLMMVPIQEFGTEAQKEEWLPKFCGESFFSATAALMEPRVMFDPFALEISAQEKGDKVVLNGRKCMVPLADRAEHFVIYAASGEGRVNAYIIDKGTPGVTIGEREKYMGMRALPLLPVTLEACELQIERRIGGERGIDYRRLLNLSRATICAMAVGVARASHEYALNYSKDRKAFDEPIASRQSIAFMLAESAMEIDAMRLLAWRAAWRLDQGEDATRYATLAKTYCADQTMKITDYGVQILGGHGYIREHPVEMWFRNGRSFATIEGLAIA